jgi:hypothetical protein
MSNEEKVKDLYKITQEKERINSIKHTLIDAIQSNCKNIASQGLAEIMDKVSKECIESINRHLDAHSQTISLKVEGFLILSSEEAASRNEEIKAKEDRIAILEAKIPIKEPLELIELKGEDPVLSAKAPVVEKENPVKVNQKNK